MTAVTAGLAGLRARGGRLRETEVMMGSTELSRLRRLLTAVTLVLAAPAAVLTVSLTGASAASAVATSAAVPAASGWSVLTAPTQNVPTNDLQALSCPTATWCMAVGSFNGSQGVQRPAAETWNGSKWTARAAASAPASLGSALLGVSCTSPSACLAVGYSVHFGLAGKPLAVRQKAYAEKWNGSKWTAVTPPAFGVPVGQSDVLTSVSCATATACTAVGSFDFVAGPQRPNGPGLLETWNGKKWARAAVPVPSKKAVALESVSCTRGNACFIAGSYFKAAATKGNAGDIYAPLVVSRPDARAPWHFRLPPAPFPTTPAAIKANKDFDLAAQSISCPTAKSCTLVGSWRHNGPPFSNPVFSESWNGSRWRLVKTANPATQLDLSSVSCWSAGNCLAIGFIGFGSSNAAVVERRANGGAFTVVGHPATPPGAGDPVLSCRSATACLTVGSGQTRGVQQSSRLQGTTWGAVPAPSPVGTLQDTLSDVACVTAGSCQAVGTYLSSDSASRVLIDSSTAGEWSLTSAPSPAGAVSELDRISCPSAGACVAVGQVRPQQLSPFTNPVAETWNGSAWSLTPVPSAGTNFGTRLADVSCSSASFCVAVGVAEQNSGTPQLPMLTSQQVVEQWNGTSWTVVPGAVPGGGTPTALRAVSCAKDGTCVALGSSDADSNPSKPLVEAYNGTSWSVASTTGLTGFVQRLSCVSASFCVAVGASADAQGSVPRALSWNGHTWTQLKVPVPSPQSGDGSQLNDVSCTSPTACTATGSNSFELLEAEGPDPSDHPFAETLTGTTWKVTNLPVGSSTVGTTLSGVSCVTATACMAAGTVLKPQFEQMPALEQHS